MKIKNIILASILLIFIINGFSQETIQTNNQNPQTNNNSSEIVNTSNIYLALGFGFPGFPSYQFGYRSQHNHAGLNISLQLGSFIIMPLYLKTDILHLYFPKPNVARQKYFGFGLGYTLTPFGRDDQFISPEFVYGLQYQTKNEKKRFIQGQLSWPLFGFRGSIKIVPLVSISYGWMF
jgi:hypothetical protein